MDQGSPRFRSIAIFLFVCTLSACGGDETNEATSSVTEPGADVVLIGSVGDGAIVDAQLTVLSASDDILKSATSDQDADYNVRLRATSEDYPLVIEATGGTDLVTSRAADFVMYGAVMHPGANVVANINPFSTLAVAAAKRMTGGLTAGNLASALQSVVTEFNSGLPPLAAFNPMTTPVDDKNVAMVVKASEALAEVLRRTHQSAAAARPELSVDDVVEALASDLVDGVLDGQGAEGASSHIAAAAILVRSQVVVESMVNALRIDGEVVTPRLDDVITRLSSGDAPSELTADQAVTAEMIEHVEVGASAAGALTGASTVDVLETALAGVSAGMRTSDVGAVMPLDVSASLDLAIVQIAGGSETSVDTVLLARDARGEVRRNSLPSIAGAAPASVPVDSPYAFQPAASDADGDALTFSIENKPTWASFDASTGALTGSPTEADIGTYSDIVISVSDGASAAQLPSFSISVEAHSPGSATLTWAPPSQNTDGTPLQDLAGYKIYWGSASRSYTSSVEIPNPGVTTYVIDNLGSGAHYFAMTAVTSSGIESEYSNEASKTIP